jgi:hypothetical protein
MKKLLLALIIPLFFFGCDPDETNDEKKDSTKTDTVSVEIVKSDTTEITLSEEEIKLKSEEALIKSEDMLKQLDEMLKTL